MAAAERVLSERLHSTKRRPPASWRSQKVSYSVGGRAKNSRFSHF